jgi:hypothetical protein
MQTSNIAALLRFQMAMDDLESRFSIASSFEIMYEKQVLH